MHGTHVTIMMGVTETHMMTVGHEATNIETGIGEVAGHQEAILIRTGTEVVFYIVFFVRLFVVSVLHTTFYNIIT
jgi:hypothetical protein